MVLCLRTLHPPVHGHLPQVLPPRLPQGQGRDHRHQHLPLRESLRHQGHPDLWPRGREDGGVLPEEPDPRQGHTGADLCLRRFPPAGVYAVYQLDPLPVLSGRHGPSESISAFWADHFQRHSRHLLYVHLQFFTPIQNLAEQFNWLQSAASSERSSPSWISSPRWWTPRTPLSWTK